MSRFPKNDLAFMLNPNHRDAGWDGTYLHDLPFSHLGHSYGITFEKKGTATFLSGGGPDGHGISMDGTDNCYFRFDGSDSRVVASGSPKVATEMHWTRFESWGTDNVSGSPGFGTNAYSWSQGSHALGVWNMDFQTAQYSKGIGIGKMTSAIWNEIPYDHNGETFDKPSDGGGDILNKWHCVLFRVGGGANTDAFLDGVAITMDHVLDIGSWNQSSDARLGDGPDGHLEGQLGFFCRWDRRLSDAEAKLAFDATKGYFGKIYP